MAKDSKTLHLPILPVKMGVLFPSGFIPIAVGRPSPVLAVEAAMVTEEKEIVVLLQKDTSSEELRREDLMKVGTRAVVKVAGRPHGEALEPYHSRVVKRPKCPYEEKQNRERGGP